MRLAKHPRGITGDNSNTRTGATVHISEEARSISSATWALVRVRSVSSKVWCPGWGVFHSKSLMSGENFLTFSDFEAP